MSDLSKFSGKIIILKIVHLQFLSPNFWSFFFQAPYLQLEIRDTAWNSRRKRTLKNICSNDPEDKNKNSHCCLWPFTVDFEQEFDWKFIVYPTKYEANMCSGDCSLGKMVPENPYSHLLQQSNVSPCCTPKKMKGINMLYMDENKNVLLGKLPNMRVEKCACA